MKNLLLNVVKTAAQLADFGPITVSVIRDLAAQQSLELEQSQLECLVTISSMYRKLTDDGDTKAIKELELTIQEALTGVKWDSIAEARESFVEYVTEHHFGQCDLWQLEMAMAYMFASNTTPEQAASYVGLNKRKNQHFHSL